MDLPPTNKIHQEFEEKFGQNAQFLEDLLKQINWKLFIKAFFIILGMVLLTLFTIVFVVKLALVII